ncbi:winged helix-turn-helix domain-containing protein [Belnapia moabensis]|uniref:winged helix-turn-helix domain-containing protein n=1 Tax=Belnapia moabensis TaxID=365533 RepID=UPI000A0001C7|nr:winged helix-turn-helix domain-containing protein [Belnapia moabensis]
MRFPSYAIGKRVFEPHRGALRAPDGTETVLRPKTAQVLLYLAERGGQVVSRHELVEAVWPGVYVTENGLTQCVADIRRALGPEEALLSTLPRRGYVLNMTPVAVAAMPAEGPCAVRHPSGIPVFAMMPFRLPCGSDPSLVAFADILLDSVVGSLSALREPIVISANSTRHLTGVREDVPALARRVGADYLASGSLQRLGERVRLSVEVSEAAQGAVVWHRAYDLTAAGLFEAPDELATTIAHMVMPRLRDAELRRALRRQHDISAYHMVLQAQAMMFRLERDSFHAAGGMLHHAVALDPGFATPHAALAHWHSLRIGQRWSADSAAEARALEVEARLALELDGGHARALALLGHSRTILHRDYDQAQDLLDRALDMAPNDAETCLWTSPTLAYTGRTTEAVGNAERAIRLSPEDPFLFRYQHFLSIAHYANGCWEQAAQWGLRSVRNNPDYTSNLAMTSAALAALGRTEEARPYVTRFTNLVPSYRVSATIPRMAFRNVAQRERYGQHLIAAGFPP